MRDLGTFRRDSTSVGVADGLNDLGHVAGHAETHSGFSRAFLWRDGRLTAAGPDLSYGYAVNNPDHVVGEFNSGLRFRAFLYRRYLR